VFIGYLNRNLPFFDQKMREGSITEEQLQWPYMPKVLNHCFRFFLMRCPLQQIKWKNKNVLILEVGVLLEK